MGRDFGQTPFFISLFFLSVSSDKNYKNIRKCGLKNLQKILAQKNQVEMF